METLRKYSKQLVKSSLPGYYLFHSRLLRTSERISWFLVFPFAVLIACLLAVPQEWTAIFGVFSLSFIAWLSIYELGYMENDVFTIDRETKPTFRIVQHEIDFIRTYFSAITIIRLLIFSLTTYLLWLFYSDHSSLTYYFAIIALTRSVFYLHNQIRSRWNILSYFTLALGKYLFLALILFQFTSPLLLVTLILIFPLPRTLEHACKVKYALKPIKRLVGELDLFRVRYYGLLAVICGLLALRFPEEGMIVPLGIFSYFFIFRSCVWVMVKFSSYQRSKFEVHQWDKR